MRRRWLTGLALLALCLGATTAQGQQPASGAPPADAPAGDAPPAEPTTSPVAPPQSPAEATPAAVPAQVDTPPAAPAPPTSFVAAPASPSPTQRPAHVPIARRWWFWAGLTAAAVGLVVGAIALSPRQPYSGNALPGVTSPF
jgi:hypothetical protein